MSATDNSGPAFPVVYEDKTAGFDPGMSLRDYFAAHASDDDVRHLYDAVWDLAPNNDQGIKKQPQNWRQIARYMHADAMLKARQS